MSVKHLLASAILMVSLAVTGLAQAGNPAHPFLGMDMIGVPSKSAPQDPTQVVPATKPSEPATGQEAVPAIPGKDSVTPAVPGKAGTPLSPTKDASPGIPFKELVPVPGAPPGIFTIDRSTIGDMGQKVVAQPTPDQLEAVYNKVWSDVAESYHDADNLKDWYLWQDKYKGQLKTTDDLEKALKEMLGSLKDEWTKYISTAEIAKQRANAQAGISDLGVWIAVNPDGSYRVDYLTYGSPSYTSELRKGDTLKSAGGKPLQGLSKDEAEALLQGKDGTTVELVYVRDGKEHTTKLAFAATVDTGVTYNMIQGTSIGYIRYNQFDQRTFAAFLAGLADLHKSANGQLGGLILDLRGNPGGEVNVALNLISIFVEKGTVLRSTTREGRMYTHQSYEVIAPNKHDFAGADAETAQMIKDFYTVPLIVLVDNSSASSSEITTGALKDTGRATIIGTQTYGKGVGYVNGRIPPGGVLFITSMHYLTPSGYNLAHKGIPPHIVVERTPGSKTDDQLLKAIDLMKTTMAPDPFKTQPASPKKTMGQDSLENNLFVIAGGIALLLALCVWGWYGHRQSRIRDAEKARQRREADE